MALSVSLSCDEETLTPGSTVLGVVNFTNYNEQIIESLTLDFKGLSSVFLNQYYSDMVSARTDYSSETYLFSRHLNLYSGDVLQHKGKYAWPFAFRIPLFAAPRYFPMWSKELFRAKYPWKGDLALEPHPLPPSMRQTGRFTCTVQYFLEATLVHRPTGMNHVKCKGRKLYASRTISVRNLEMPPRTIHDGDWPYAVHRYKMHRRLLEPSHRHVRRILPLFCREESDQFHESEVELCFSVLLPRRFEIVTQQALSIPVSCTVDGLVTTQEEGSSSVGQFPDIIVRSFKLSLVQHIQVRAGSHTSSSSKRIFTRKGSCLVPVSRMNRATSETAASTAAPFVNLADAVNLFVPGDLMAPDFSTYNIARSHTLELSFRMQCGSRKHKFMLRRIPLKVVPHSGMLLERRLSEGLEADDEYGCNLAGIRWRDYRHSTRGTGAGTPDLLHAAREYPGVDCDIDPGIPPPPYRS